MNHPKVGIGVLIFRDQKLLLGKRQNNHGALTWGPPGGHLEFGESFEACAIRETLEETGLLLSSPQFVTLTNDIFTAENKHYVSIFLSTQLPIGQEVKNLEPEKLLVWEWFNLNELPENLFLPLKNLLQLKGVAFLLQLSSQALSSFL